MGCLPVLQNMFTSRANLWCISCSCQVHIGYSPCSITSLDPWAQLPRVYLVPTSNASVRHDLLVSGRWEGNFYAGCCCFRYACGEGVIVEMTNFLGDSDGGVSIDRRRRLLLESNHTRHSSDHALVLNEVEPLKWLLGKRSSTSPTSCDKSMPCFVFC